MLESPGQITGQPAFSWAAYLDALIDERGSLAAVAAQMASQRGFEEALDSIERGLRRLRKRGQRDGGVWGRRALQTFGLPKSVDQRVRWMGHYHSRFTDLPTSICAELLAAWDRPPISESAARVWVQLGLASLALRRRDREAAAKHLQQAALTTAPPAAQAELHLVQAYVVPREDRAAREHHLAQASEVIIEELDQDQGDGACLFARLIDQRAYNLNKPHEGAPDHKAALELYQQIPAQAPLFALCRKHNGLGWSKLKLGDREAAVLHARQSVTHAGDLGSLRLRAMALNLLAASADPEEARSAGTRAAQIAERLEDEELTVRFSRLGLSAAAT